MNHWRHRFRVWFADDTHRDVMAQSVAGALKTGARAQRVVGYKKLACKAVRAEDLGHLGTGEQWCPRCGGLFAEVAGEAEASTTEGD